MKWIVYILRCVDDSLYTGITTDLKNRLIKHNSGTGAKYTRSRLPVKLVWKTSARTQSLARKKEYQIKSLDKIEKEKLVKRFKFT